MKTPDIIAVEAFETYGKRDGIPFQDVKKLLVNASVLGMVAMQKKCVNILSMMRVRAEHDTPDEFLKEVIIDELNTAIQKLLTIDPNKFVKEGDE